MSVNTCRLDGAPCFWASGAPFLTLLPMRLAASAIVGGMLALAGVGGAATPNASPTATVTVEGRPRPVRQAIFGISISDETWDAASKIWRRGRQHAQVAYSLHVDVDEHSGDDGALQPAVERIPVARANGGRHPSFATLGTLMVRELDDGYDCDEWHAWYGNDAPGLCQNVVQFQGWQQGALRVRWSAHYDDGRGPRPLVFEGPATFKGIYLRVTQDEDPDAFLAAVWGGEPASQLERYPLDKGDHGPNWPAAWRFWASYVYVPKGQPLPSYYSPRPK